MQPVISKCGNMCSSCPWGIWVRRNQTDDEWEEYSAEVKEYVGFSPTKNPCHGCQTPNENLAKDVGMHNVLRGCSARKCAFHNEIKNCAYCSRFPCDKIKLLNASNSRDHAEERIGNPIPEEKYQKYVRIFEGQKYLDEIRGGLKPDQIKQVKTVDVKVPRITTLPEISSQFQHYKQLHITMTKIIESELGLHDTDTVAVQGVLEDRRAVLLRFLWILATYGAIDEKTLSVDSLTINTYKKGTSGFPTTEKSWMRFLDNLSEVGIKGKLVLAPISKSVLVSPMGWLRERIPDTDEPGYHVSISFGKKLGGFDSLKFLHTFANELETRFGKKSYSKFKTADMRYLAESK